MTDREKQIEAHNRATGEFIELANRLAAEEDGDKALISAALMAASGIYATFLAAGNNGFLGESGVKHVAGLYERNLAYIQNRKREEMQAQGLKPISRGEAESRKALSGKRRPSKPEQDAS